ncbi:MAG: DUF4160 domain-containing protein [Treponema sp.]|nr:DUF4160 domain-containing protein [Treponema sp.]
MPIVSEFEGIEICFYFDDHLPPHFHAKYGDAEALVDIGRSCVLKGALPSNKLKLVLAWSELHRDELVKNWEKASKKLLPQKIEPLK